MTNKNSTTAVRTAYLHCMVGAFQGIFFAVETTLLLTKFKQKHFAKTNFLVYVTLIDFI